MDTRGETVSWKVTVTKISKEVYWCQTQNPSMPTMTLQNKLKF